MPGTTARGFRYPLSTESPAGHTQIQNLAEDVNAEFDANLTLGGNLTIPGSLTLGPNSLVMLPLQATKAGDESVTSSTTLQNDDHLVVSLPAVTRTWLIIASLIVDAGPSGDLKLDWTGPAGCVLRMGWAADSLANAGNANEISHYMQQSLSDVVSIGGFASGGGTPRPATGIGVVKNAGTAGSLQLRFAQVASNSTPSKLLQHSTIALLPIGP